MNTEIKKKKRLLMSNPRNFVTIANSLGVFYEHILEGKESLGPTNLARLFEGNSSRGGINSTCIDCWINTFEYLINNPKHTDNEIPKPFSMKPTEKYFEFIKQISKVIPDSEIENWNSISKKKLSEEAPKHQFTIGIKNSKSILTLLDRMFEMVKRRKNNIWSKTFPKVIVNQTDYNMKNVPELRLICKERNLPNAHITKKEDLVKLLEDNPLNSIHNDKNNEKVDYTKFNCRELKVLAKNRQLTKYNNLKKDELVKLHVNYDEDIKMIQEEEVVDKEVESDYEKENIKTEENYTEINNKEEDKKDKITITKNTNELNRIFKFDDKIIRTTGTYENPLFVVKDIADILDLTNYKNVYSKMDDYMKKDGVQFLDSIGRKQEMQVINEPGLYYMIIRSNKPNAKLFQRKVYEEILPSIRKTGGYVLEDKYKFILDNNRPLSQVMNNTDMDKEAIEIEKLYNWSKNSNCPIIYIAYIGDGLVKVGFSDSKFDERLCKHISSESKYKQFVILETFEVSGKPAEDIIHKLLDRYRFIFEKQKEIYKPDGTLNKFIEHIKELLSDNDYKLKYIRLILKYNELEKENLQLKLQIK
jgi:prophage antirepressor-like protein